MSARSRSAPETHARNVFKAQLIAPPFYAAIKSHHPDLTNAQVDGMKDARDKNLQINQPRFGYKIRPMRYKKVEAA